MPVDNLSIGLARAVELQSVELDSEAPLVKAMTSYYDLTADFSAAGSVREIEFSLGHTMEIASFDEVVLYLDDQGTFDASLHNEDYEEIDFDPQLGAPVHSEQHTAAGSAELNHLVTEMEQFRAQQDLRQIARMFRNFRRSLVRYA